MSSNKKQTAVLIVTIATCCCALDAHAQVGIEAYPKKRPSEVTPTVERYSRYLQHYGVVAGAQPTKTTMASHAKLATPAVVDPTLTFLRLVERIDSGATMFLRGEKNQVPAAKAQLESVIADAHANPGVVISDESARDEMTRAYVHLALCRERLKDRPGALAALAEQARSFPELPVTRGKFGTEALGLYTEMQKELASQRTGLLEIKVDNPAAQIFVNEFARGERGTFREQRKPGDYRVVIQVGAKSLRFNLPVRSGEHTELVVDWALEMALTVSDEWVGLTLTSSTPDAEELSLVRKLSAKMQGMNSFVVTTVAVDKPGQRVTSTLYRGGAEMALVRRGRAQLDGVIDEPKLDALAKFVTKGVASPHVVDLTVVASPFLPVRRAAEAPKREGSSWRPWVLGGLGFVALNAGLYFSFTAKAPEEGQQQETVRSTPGMVLQIAGGVAITTASVLWMWETKSGARRAIPFVATMGGLVALDFGIALIANDDDTPKADGVLVNDTADEGFYLGAAGAAVAVVAGYLWWRSTRSRVAPRISVSRDHAFAGFTAAF